MRRTNRWATMPTMAALTRYGSTDRFCSRVIADGESLVCSVGKHQVTSQSGLHRDPGGLRIADFPNHDHVRVLAQQGAEHGREIQPDLAVDLELVDPSQVELHRILDGADVDGGVVQMVEHRVERRALAAAGRAGDQDDPVWVFANAFQPGTGLGGQPEPVEGQQAAGIVNDAGDHLFAELVGQGGDAQVHRLAAVVDADGPVLGQSAFGNIHPGHDLDAGYDGGHHLVRGM
jgi:hypothetical protein